MNDRVVVALSGVVGAGKSTVAKTIVRGLRSAGHPAEHIRFQDFTQLRLRARRGAVDSADGELLNPDAAERAHQRRWPSYRRRRMTMMVAAGYMLRTLVFRSRLRRAPRETVLVFDRYFYDSLAHFELETAGWPLRLLLRVIPAPTVASMLLVGEATMCERRPRYSPEYASRVTENYEALATRLDGLIVARTDDAAVMTDVAERIVSMVSGRNGRQ